MNKSTSDVINLYKPAGLTPAQTIDEFRKINKKYNSESISHAGRLDPLAEGVLLLVTGKKTQEQNLRKFMKLDKEYMAKIFFGFSTDSYDIQGIAKKSEIKYSDIDLEGLKQRILSLKGEYEHEIPGFSGRMVNGKPLHYYARNNRLDEIKLPKEKVLIKDIDVEKIEKIKGRDLLKQILQRINLLNGDFRQEEIKKKWQELLKNEDESEYLVLEVLISCSSGTYIRSIVNDIGKNFGTGVLLNLIRTKVGDFSFKDSERLK
jgi:tRNA pseudouridine55 synthase